MVQPPTALLHRRMSHALASDSERPMFPAIGGMSSAGAISTRPTHVAGGGHIERYQVSIKNALTSSRSHRRRRSGPLADPVPAYGEDAANALGNRRSRRFADASDAPRTTPRSGGVACPLESRRRDSERRIARADPKSKISGRAFGVVPRHANIELALS